MADLFASTDDGDDERDSPHVVVASPPPAFPPPTPLEEDTRRLKILAFVAALAIAAAVASGLLWMSANSSTNDAESARDVARADAGAATDRARDLSDQLAASETDLTTAQAANDVLRAERDDALAASDDSDRATEQQTLVDELTVVNERLAEEIATLREELDTAPETVPPDSDGNSESEGEGEDEGEADPGSDASVGATTFASAANPGFARFIGETLTSRTGSSRLTQTQSECFGSAIVDDIGLEALGNGLTLAASSADNNAVVAAMQRAAGSCNIDLSLVF